MGVKPVFESKDSLLLQLSSQIWSYAPQTGPDCEFSQFTLSQMQLFPDSIKLGKKPIQIILLSYYLATKALHFSMI